MTSPNQLFQRPLRERLPLLQAPRWAELAIVLLGMVLAVQVRLAVGGFLGPGFPFITFLPVLIVTTFVLGPRAGSMSAITGSLAALYFFLPPFHSFELTISSAVALSFNLFTNAAIIGLFYWMQRANAALVVERETSARLAKTRELLFRELQHRVSNNLQMVGALLTLQRRQIDDPRAKAALDEASRRLSTVGRISRQLYDPAGGGQQLKPFLDQLARDIIETSGHGHVTHQVEGDVEADLQSEAAIPLALVVAEAVANAIEHGFEGRTDCKLHIRLARTADQSLAIEVEDNGHGLPKGFALEGSNSLGLKIATMLAGQLGGRFSLAPSKQDRGSVARLELPLAA